MSRYKLWIFALALLLTATGSVFPGVALAAPEFIAVNEIQQGMRGVAKTVVAGTQIEEFGVEVLGILKNKGPVGDLILVRTYGDVIDRTGGIVEGMSGSPVYFDGKLAGAIAYGWSLTDHTIGMVTPIGDMLALWDMADRTGRKMEVDKPVETGGQEADKDGEAVKTPETVKPLATPLMVSGLSPQAVALLQDKLKTFNVVPYAVGDAPTGFSGGKLEPGSPIGAELVRGDVSISAIGTVTYVDGDKILAFGHPFLKKGNTDYFMSDAYILTTVKGLENGFKVGTTGDLIGRINQDRGAGIGGQIGQYPSLIPLRVTVQDNALNRSQEMAVQVVNDEQLAPALAAISVFNAMDKTSDRTGGGTARVSFEITGNGLPVDVVKRENMFYNSANIGEQAVSEILEALAILCGNQFNPVDIFDVKVNVTLDQERRTAAIQEAKTKAVTVKPGETVALEVKLKPFRGEPITRTVNYMVPKDQKPGPLMLEVRGGGMVPLLQLLLAQQGLDKDALVGKAKKAQSFDAMLRNFMERDRNNDLVVEVMNPEAGMLPGEGQAEGSKKAAAPKETKPVPHQDEQAKSGKLDKPQAAKEPEGKKNKNFVTTDYIIEGDTQVLVNVEDK